MANLIREIKELSGIDGDFVRIYEQTLDLIPKVLDTGKSADLPKVLVNCEKLENIYKIIRGNPDKLELHFNQIIYLSENIVYASEGLLTL